jgi:hypothetical protein
MYTKSAVSEPILKHVHRGELGYKSSFFQMHRLHLYVITSP